MKPKVVLYKTLPDHEMALLERHFKVIAFQDVNDSNQDAFRAAIHDADGIIGSGIMMSNEVLEQAQNLKAAATISVGTDHFDLAYLSKRGIPLIHTPGVLNETVADTVILLALGAARRATELSIMVREGRWLKSLTEEHFGVDLHGKTMGIVGMGRIGCAVAKRAHHGFGMPIYYCNTNYIN
ncbi:NAD(P)-dependent oxidoreductase [Vibrio sp. FJH11]